MAPSFETARAHDVEAGEQVRPFHPYPERAVTAHSMSGQPAADGLCERTVMAIDIGNQIVGDKLLQGASHLNRGCISDDHDRLAETRSCRKRSCESIHLVDRTVGRLSGIMQEIHYRETARLIDCIA